MMHEALPADFERSPNQLSPDVLHNPSSLFGSADRYSG